MRHGERIGSRDDDAYEGAEQSVSDSKRKTRVDAADLARDMSEKEPTDVRGREGRFPSLAHERDLDPSCARRRQTAALKAQGPRLELVLDLEREPVFPPIELPRVSETSASSFKRTASSSGHLSEARFGPDRGRLASIPIEEIGKGIEGREQLDGRGLSAGRETFDGSGELPVDPRDLGSAGLEEVATRLAVLVERPDSIDRGPIEVIPEIPRRPEKDEIEGIGKEWTHGPRVVPELQGNEGRRIEALAESGRSEKLMDAAPLRMTSTKCTAREEKVGFRKPPLVGLPGFVPECTGAGIPAPPEELDEAFALFLAGELDELRALARRDQEVNLVLEEACGFGGDRKEKEHGETAHEATHLRDDSMGCARTVWYSTTCSA